MEQFQQQMQEEESKGIPEAIVLPHESLADVARLRTELDLATVLKKIQDSKGNRLRPAKRAENARAELVVLSGELTGKSPEALELALFENTAVQELQGCISNATLPDVDIYTICNSLTGIDSRGAWEIRREMLLDHPEVNTIPSILTGLAGADSETAWQLRHRALSLGGDYDAVSTSLGGLDNERAWEMREYIKSKTSSNVPSMRGLDSDRAWESRDKLFATGWGTATLYPSIGGLDSERSWQLRQKLAERNPEPWAVALSLIAVDSERAWKMRAELEDANALALSLAGIDTPQSWEMRKKASRGRADLLYMAKSLAGLDSPRAWKARKELVKRGLSRLSVANEINGPSAIAWRAARGLLPHQQQQLRN